MAERFLVALLMALDIRKACQVPPRQNLVFQPFGKGVCGQFVLHFQMDRIRRFFGEGPTAGYPDYKEWTAKMATAMDKIVQNKNLSNITQAAKKVIKKIDDAKAKAEADAKLLADSRSFQDEVAKLASIAVGKGFGHFGGCSKCAFAKLGSTCCNPNKIEAKARAEKEMKEKSLSTAEFLQRYKHHFMEVCLEIVKRHTGVDNLPDKTKKGGGCATSVHMSEPRIYLRKS